MAAKLIDLADAIKAQLAAATFTTLGSTIGSAGGSIRREYVPREHLESLSALLVTIIPNDEEVVQVARGLWQYDWTLEMGIQKRVASEVADADTMLNLTQDVCDWLRTVEPTSPTGARNVRVKLHTPYVPEHLDQDKVFTSILLATFRLVRT